MLRDTFEDYRLEIESKLKEIKLHPNQYAKELVNLYRRQLSWFEQHGLLV